MSIEFEPWPKIARLNRDIVITEKIDGTNAAVVIVPFLLGEGVFPDERRIAIIALDDERDDSGQYVTEYHVYAQSRTRFITPEQDNFGFARWVRDNAEGLVATLGEGRHFGEWWGSGIQRGYGLPKGEKRFSLFNTTRWLMGDTPWDLDKVPGLGVVPLLYEGPFSQFEIEMQLASLASNGTHAGAPGFKAEGIVIFHTASRELFKVTIEGDEAPKGEAGHAGDVEK